MIITNEVPNSWRDLQDKVCKYLNQAGYHAESPKTIPLVRGEVEVDVFATAQDEMLKQFICECKFWDTPVPKEKIHAFRTVVQDSGSMLGIFISKEGYQKGAVEAAYCSNVLLKDWAGFIDMIATQWLKNRSRQISRLIHPLSVYTDPLDVSQEVFFSENDKQRYFALQSKYVDAYVLFRGLEMGMHKPEDPVVLNGQQFDDFNSFFNYIETVCLQGIEEFEAFFSKNPVESWKLDGSKHMMFETQICDYLTK